MLNLQDYYTALDALVPGTIPLGEPEKLIAINNALRLHSKYKPLRVTEDVPGDGGFDYPVATAFASWDDEFSTILQVEYPVDDTVVESSYLEDEDWILYEKPSGKVLRFLSEKPLATETFRVTYTVPHNFDEITDAGTVAASDDIAVQKLAASFFCRQLAAAYAQDQDSTIQADSVDHASKRREYEAQAQKYRGEYDELMGIQKGVRPASYNQDQDVVYPGGIDRLTHPRRNR